MTTAIETDEAVVPDTTPPKVSDRDEDDDDPNALNSLSRFTLFETKSCVILHGDLSYQRSTDREQALLHYRLHRQLSPGTQDRPDRSDDLECDGGRDDV